MRPDMQRPPAGTEGRQSPKGGDPDSSESTAQLDIFAAIDAADEGRRLRDDGMRTAVHATDVRVRSALETVIADLAASGREFTADDVRAQVDPASPNVLGAAFSAAARAGAIVCIGATTSTAPSRHGGLTRVWRGA